MPAPVFSPPSFPPAPNLALVILGGGVQKSLVVSRFSSFHVYSFPVSQFCSLQSLGYGKHHRIRVIGADGDWTVIDYGDQTLLRKRRRR